MRNKSSKVPRPCLSCGELTTNTTRCSGCEQARERKRNASPYRAAYKDREYLSFVKDSRCALCGSTEELTKDHKIPLAKGGTNDASNLWTLCRPCNSAKGVSMDWNKLQQQ